MKRLTAGMEPSPTTASRRMQETIKPNNKALTACSDTPIPLPEVCSKFPPTAAHSYNLCVGLKKILSAPCSALYNHTFLESAIATVGVVPDTREERLYGESAKHMVKGLYGSQHYKPNVGLWQEPQQLAAALIAAANLDAPQHPVHLSDRPRAQIAREWWRVGGHARQTESVRNGAQIRVEGWLQRHCAREQGPRPALTARDVTR